MPQLTEPIMRRDLRGLWLLLAALTAGASTGHAAWGPDPVQISTTTAEVRLLVSCSDGADGALVAWQEGTNGIVRAHHLLASGDLDPAWPANGLIACAIADKRPYMDIVSDGTGGAYVVWLENASSTAMETADFYATRITPDGQVASGWPARGQLVGVAGLTRPDVAGDGSGGLYLVWPVYGGSPDYLEIRAHHLGPDNLPAGGWTGGSKSISGKQPSVTEDLWPQVIAASDGGALISWCQTASPAGTQRLMRIAPNGNAASGWAEGGMAIATFGGRIMSLPVRDALIAMTRSDGGDLFIFSASSLDYGGTQLRLRRLTESGLPAPAWTADGKLVVTDEFEQFGALDLLPDALDGAILGLFVFSLHVTRYDFWSFPASGASSQFASQYGWWYHDAVPTGAGNVFAAGSWTSKWNQYEPWPFVNFKQLPTPSGYTNFSESYSVNTLSYYGDVSICRATGGAIFMWSQDRERVGVFAMRFDSSGPVVDVAPEVPGGAMIRSWFDRAAGIRVAGSMAPGANGRIDVFDIVGRRVSTARIVAGGAFATIMPGTIELASGAYFVRVTHGDDVMSGRVAVVR
jgi:hypothetical protein